ncbi:PI-PLC X domain-containing protein 3 [Oratosquilla oratoria]|uniref:PI-PLC X domain-containing protein 3 n=1 Tax=Oratosquilla oratoria TaxID=337810 RepID=UPI003F766541
MSHIITIEADVERQSLGENEVPDEVPPRPCSRTSSRPQREASGHASSKGSKPGTGVKLFRERKAKQAKCHQVRPERRGFFCENINNTNNINTLTISNNTNILTLNKNNNNNDISKNRSVPIELSNGRLVPLFRRKKSPAFNSRRNSSEVRGIANVHFPPKALQFDETPAETRFLERTEPLQRIFLVSRDGGRRLDSASLSTLTSHYHHPLGPTISNGHLPLELSTSTTYSPSSLSPAGSRPCPRGLNPAGRHRVASEGNLLTSTADLECWMTRLPSRLHHLPLHHLLIPGSHDAFSYGLQKGGEVAPDTPWYLQKLGRAVPCLALPAIRRWSVTQLATTWEQLVHGVRYFDIRVALQDSRFRFVHGLYGDDLEPILVEMRRFLTKRPGEVILLDFQHFHGLESKDHQDLIALIRNTFQELLCPFLHNLGRLTLSYLNSCKYQVLVFYRNVAAQTVKYMWSGSSLPNPWPNTTSPSAMFHFLEQNLQKRAADAFFVTQCVLTPTPGYLLRHAGGGLEEKMARPCNDAVEEWLQEGVRPGPKSPNVVMLDFVHLHDWALPKAIVNMNLRSVFESPFDVV